MIIVTGANGKLGRATVKSLLSLRPAAEIAASVRDPERAGTCGTSASRFAGPTIAIRTACGGGSRGPSRC